MDCDLKTQEKGLPFEPCNEVLESEEITQKQVLTVKEQKDRIQVKETRTNFTFSQCRKQN